MVRILFLALFALATFAPWTAFSQEVAGRVLIAVGEVTIERGAQQFPARTGTEVRAGDLFRLGAASNAQIRLTDDSIVALRPETTFRIAEYSYRDRKPEEQRAFFDLVKGGMRTVTGVIGRLHQRNYGVNTPTATIGIRGTHYALHQSSPLVGVVTDGVISVRTQVAEILFGADQYFRVDGPNAVPERTIAPPPQLRDAGSARPKVAAKPEPEKPAPAKPAPDKPAVATASGSEAAPAVAQTGLGGGTGDVSTASAITSLPPPVEQTATLFQATTTASTAGPAAVLQPTGSGTVLYRIEGPFNIPVTTCLDPGGGCGNIVAGDITLGVNLTLQLAGVAVNIENANGDKFNGGSPFGPNNPGIPITISGGQITFNATFNRTDFPQNQGAFRCSECGPGGTVGFADTISVSGTISGSQATLLLGATDAGGGGSFTVTLTQQAPPNNDVAAIATPTLSGGASARSAAYWAVTLDSSRRLVDFGPTVGQIRASVGTAANTIDGSAPSAGNLVWGHWSGPGATITDFNYATFSTTAGSIQQWITGEATNTLPPSLGVLTYTPVGSFVNNGVSGMLNSGSLTADFVNRQVALSLNATNIPANNTFQMNGVSSFSSVSGRFSAGFASVTCTGTCAGPGTPGGSFGGFFAGPNAEGAGVAFTAGFGAGTGVSGVVGFRR
jgi:hypothetical protein